ncbi:lipase 3-like isoform X1 [Hylaeus anthracinus]|uniref:lipase 3-like isoform X1 n=1 Tax=Hylaeus anthracinus TaxID=313031 RepID=UPI0023B91F96|nr:lipase 3-like isoform X1 [Hylaeus anthracinus]XP_054002057.1 lipase 3-like isoform X1 [Hylaeus anthracinus]
MSGVSNQDETHMTTPELIDTHGYKSETHQIWTEDGYCLDVHRVLPPKTDENEYCKNNVNIVHNRKITEYTNYEFTQNTKARVPVLIQHGVLSSSADWVLLGPKKALAYVLCDNNYDVWLGNTRGNAYGKKHRQYTTTDKEFWNFSWHEVGYYDLPATIDYILEQTGYTKLYYVGYSQGTTAFYVMASERSEYNSKIKGMVSLAPIAFLSNQRSPLFKYIVHFHGLMEWGSSYCNVHQWFPRNKLQAQALGTLIRNAPSSLTKGFCAYWFYLIAGFGSDQLDESMLPLIFGHFPAGVSAKQLVHYSQSILSGSFRKFDYGASENLKIYGSTQPPKYDLENVKIPIMIFYSENDFLTDPADVRKLVDRLPNVIETRTIEYAKFNHIDYLWGRDAKTLVYNAVLTALKRFK